MSRREEVTAGRERRVILGDVFSWWGRRQGGGLAASLGSLRSLVNSPCGLDVLGNREARTAELLICFVSCHLFGA